MSRQTAGNDILLLLPLSGGNAALGKGILRACILTCRTDDHRNVDFHVVDTADPALEKAKLHDKFKDKNLKAIIGPVFFQEAKQYGALFPEVPILTFSNNLSVNSDHIVACGISPQEEVKTLFAFAISRGIDGFLVMLPEGEAGDQVLSCVKNEAQRHDLEDDLTVVRYVGISSKDATKCARSSGKKAIFLMEPVVNTQKLEDMDVFTLSSSALSGGARAWNDAIFAFAGGPNQAEFSEKYRRIFGKNPTILDIIGHDLMEAVGQSVTNRHSVFEGKYSGCLGNFLIRKRVGLKRRLGVFRFENHEMIKLR